MKYFNRFVIVFRIYKVIKLLIFSRCKTNILVSFPMMSFGIGSEVKRVFVKTKKIKKCTLILEIYK